MVLSYNTAYTSLDRGCGILGFCALRRFFNVSILYLTHFEI